MTRNIDCLMMQAVVAELKEKAGAVRKAFGGGSLDQVAVRDAMASSVVQLKEEGVLFLVIFLNTLCPEDGLLNFEQMEQGLAYWSTEHVDMPIAAPQQVRESGAGSESLPAVRGSKTSGARVENGWGWGGCTDVVKRGRAQPELTAQCVCERGVREISTRYVYTL